MGLVLVSDGRAVSAGDAAAPSFLQRLPGGIFERTVKRVLGLVDVHVDHSAVFLRQVEHKIHMAQLQLVEPLGCGHAADHITPQLHRLVQQPVGALVAKNALLREGDHLQVANVLCGFLCQEHALQRNEFGVKAADIDVCAQFGRAIHNAFADGAQGPLVDVLHGILPDPVVHDADGILQRLGAVLPPTQRSVGLVKMHVRVDKSRGRHHPPGVDALRVRAGGCINLGGDFQVPAVVADQNILRAAVAENAGVLNEQHILLPPFDSFDPEMHGISFLKLAYRRLRPQTSISCRAIYERR